MAVMMPFSTFLAMRGCASRYEIAFQCASKEESSYIYYAAVYAHDITSITINPVSSKILTFTDGAKK